VLTESVSSFVSGRVASCASIIGQRPQASSPRRPAPLRAGLSGWVKKHRPRHWRTDFGPGSDRQGRNPEWSCSVCAGRVARAGGLRAGQIPVWNPFKRRWRSGGILSHDFRNRPSNVYQLRFRERRADERQEVSSNIRGRGERL